MAIKHVVTFGFGFADGVKFVPPLGFGLVEIVTNPISLTLKPRSAALTLKTRSTALTLEARSTALTLKSRDD